MCLELSHHISAALVLSGSPFQRRGAWAHKALSPNFFRLMSGTCNNFLVFDLRGLSFACWTNKAQISFAVGDLESDIVLQYHIRQAYSIYPTCITVCPKSCFLTYFIPRQPTSNINKRSSFILSQS